MSPSVKIDIDTLLNHSLSEEMTSDVNKDVIERRNFSPKKICLFSKGYTSLEEQPEYKFSNDKEAEKVLPDIINNNVQKIIGDSKKTEKDKKFFSKQRNIGVAAMKPIGCSEEGAQVFIDTFGMKEDVKLVAPYSYKENISPYFAFVRHKIDFDMKKIVESYQTISKAHDVTLVEGTSGLLDPLVN